MNIHDIKVILTDNDIAFMEQANKGHEVRIKWENKFAHTLSKSQKKKIKVESLLWHVFSYKKVVCLENEEAIKAFNNEQKKECFIFTQEDENILYLNSAKKLHAQDFLLLNFEFLSDIYFVDKEFTWTFVRTHESYCGPYYYKSSLG